MKEKKCNCVEFNIYVECEKNNKPEPPYSPCEAAEKGEHDKDKDKDDSCVKINLYVDCGKECHKFTI